jgi:hypothetical protein
MTNGIGRVPSLAKKLALLITGFFLLAGSALVYFDDRSGYAMLEEQTQAKAHGVVEFGKAILERVMLSGQNAHLQDALDKSITSEQAADVLILSKDGTILLRAHSAGRNEKLPLQEFREFKQWPGERFMSIRENGSLYEYILTPIVKKPECFQCHKENEATKGYIVAKIAMDDLAAIAAKRRRANLFLIFLAFGGLGIVIYQALSFWVVKPVERLNAHIQQVKGHLPALVEGHTVDLPVFTITTGKDQTFSIAQDFNELLQQINEMNRRNAELPKIQMEQADRLATAGEMIASVAHRIRNPMAGLLGALQVFDSEMADADPHKKIIAEMRLQLERMDHAVSDLFSYTRPQPLVCTDVLLNELVGKTVELFSRQIGNGAINVEMELSDSVPIIVGDEKQLQQVLWNVMLNAIEAMDASGTLSVRTKAGDTEVAIMIGDTGMGISRKNRLLIFNPFYTTKAEGSGLGLTISKRIVEQHRGWIAVSSEAGRGTKVIVTLPIQAGLKSVAEY